MSRVIVFLYGVGAYAAFFVAILYAIGFLANVVVPKGIDDGEIGPLGPSALVDVLLLAAFALQHTIMARPGFKTWWTRLVPRPMERSTFVLAASLLLMLLYWQWRPLPDPVWRVDQPILRGVIWGLYAVGWATVFYATFLIDHFDLFGLRQVVLHLRRREYSHPAFVERSLYKLIRHPLMAGFIIAFWSAPTMSEGRLLFAAVATAYIFFGITLEERDLVRILGDDYVRYRARTSMIVPIPKGRR